MKKLGIFIFAIVIAGAGFFLFSQQRPAEDRVIIGFARPWVSIEPGQVETAASYTLARLVYECLIYADGSSHYTPGVATAWNLDDSGTKAQFVIDTTRKFSDGTPVSASVIKINWENLLRVGKAKPRVLNSVRIIKGADAFFSGKASNIVGIEAPDDGHLSLTFTAPLRRQPNFYTGCDLPVVKRSGSNFVGTGSYVVSEFKSDNIRFVQNPFTSRLPEFNEITAKYVTNTEGITQLKIGVLDLLLLADASTLLNNLEEYSFISIDSSYESRRQMLIPNSKKGRIFSNPLARKALGYLIDKVFTDPDLPVQIRKPHFIRDGQVFSELSLGRLSQSEVPENNEGKQFVSSLIKLTQREPITLISYLEHVHWLQKSLEREGLIFSKNSGYKKVTEVIGDYEGNTSSDLILLFNGEPTGDPDDISEVLESKGSLHSPMIADGPWASMLKEGRNILQVPMTDSFYKQLSKRLLTDFPIINLGFNVESRIYNNKVLTPAVSGLEKYDSGILSFKRIR